jgi:hypothetical protein
VWAVLVIDHCYYLNLDKREDRNRHTLKLVLPFFNFKDGFFTRYPAIDTSEQPTLPLRSVGCAQSHLNIYKDAIEKGYKTIIVLEDDFIPVIETGELLSRWNYFIQRYPDFNICQLSYNDVTKGEPIDSSGLVLKSNNVQTTSAYVIKLSFCEKIVPKIQTSIDALKNGEDPNLHAIDQTWKSFQSLDHKWYLLKRCGVQANDYSDIEGRVVNYGC